MKRLFTILCICLCVIPFFAVPASAADYVFDYPKQFSYEGIAIPEKWLSVLEYDATNSTLVRGSLNTLSKFGFGYYRNYESYSYSEYNALWYLGDHGITSSDVFRNVRVPGYIELNPTLYFATTSNISSHLIYAQFIRENVLIPINGQYFKYQMQFDTAIINAPDVVNNFIDPSTLCFFCDTSGIAGNASKYSLPKLLPSAVYKSTSGDIVRFTFYFDLTGNEFDVLRDSENVCFAVRIPYYFDGKTDWNQGVRLISNADIPGTYSILNVGGYEQDLEDILTSVDKVVTELNDVERKLFSTTEDVLIVDNALADLNDNEYIFQDFENVNDQIDNIVDDVTIGKPNDLTGFTDDAISAIFNIFTGQSLFYIKIFTTVFTLALISLVLYGIRG